MKDCQLTKAGLPEFFNDIQKELEVSPLLVVSVQSGKTGKWGMAKLFRAWMTTTAEFMSDRGVTMPLMIAATGKYHGTRPFNAEDAHLLFTSQWLGVDENGFRLSWSKKGRDGMRAATKEERYYALNRHEVWGLEKGLVLFKPRDSEYEQMQRGETQC